VDFILTGSYQHVNPRKAPVTKAENTHDVNIMWTICGKNFLPLTSPERIDLLRFFLYNYLRFIAKFLYFFEN
jgi:hypothetical protein